MGTPVIEPVPRPRPLVVGDADSSAAAAYIYGDVLAQVHRNGDLGKAAGSRGLIAAGLLVGSHYQCPLNHRPYVEVEGFVGGAQVASFLDLLKQWRGEWKAAALALKYHFPAGELVGWFASLDGTIGTADAPPDDAQLLHRTFFNHPWQIGLFAPRERTSPRVFAVERDQLESHGVCVIQGRTSR